MPEPHSHGPDGMPVYPTATEYESGAGAVPDPTPDASPGGSIPLSDLSNAGYTDPGDNQGSLVVAPSSGSGKKAGLTDVQGINGSGNGVFWKTQGVDGDQVLEVYTGDNGVHVLRFTAAGILSVDDVDVLDVSDGVLRFPALPTADPTVAGALWNDAGTVKISAG